MLVMIWFGLGCGTIKNIFSNDKDDHVPPAPEISEVEFDKDGNPIFTDKLSDKPFNWKGAFLVVGLLITSGLIVRHFYKGKDD